MFCLLRAWFLSRAGLVAENLALHQQVAVLKQGRPRPRLRPRDRVFWVWLTRLWGGWRSALVLVQPETVVGWHRQGFRLYWRWKSRARGSGRPKVDAEIRQLIRQMCRENRTWGAPRIQSELRLLGYAVSETTVAKYMIRSPRPSSQSWRAFLDNHVQDLAALDFFTVPTATFRVLYCLVVLRHARRRVMHFNVTEHPTAAWTAQQVVEAFPFDEAPRFLLRDNDQIYGEVFQKRVENLGIDEVKTAKGSPWQNPYVERLIGSLRRECLDHVIVLGERHLKGILGDYFEYYHQARTHLSLDRNAPAPRDVEPPSRGRILCVSQVGGLHHWYRRVA